MRTHTLLTSSRTGILAFCLAAVASLHADQQPGTADQPSGIIPFPRTPSASQFQRPQLDRQFQAAPEIKQFPPPTMWTSRLPLRVVTPNRAEAPRVVCGMVVVPGNADLDRKILREVPPDAPKGAIRSVEGTCEQPVAVNVVPAPGTPSPVR